MIQKYCDQGSVEMLIDSHIHIAMIGQQPKPDWNALGTESKIELIRDTIKQYKKRNIFAVRDGGDDAFVSMLAREVAESEDFIYKTPIRAFHKKGCYGSFLGKAIDGMDNFKEEYKTLLKYKPDHLKIILTGIVNFKCYGDVGKIGFTSKELHYMVDSAKSDNLPVMAHANGCEGVMQAINAGVSTIEHGYLISEAELYGMAENNIIWVPTLSPLGNILSSNDETFIVERDTIQKVYDLQVENIKRAYNIGVKVALGSDAGAYRVLHGSGLMDETAHFEEIGFSRQQVEKMCFENGIKGLNLNKSEIKKAQTWSNFEGSFEYMK
jgi:imidazolonepropionase-like amidohydrolase